MDEYVVYGVEENGKETKVYDGSYYECKYFCDKHNKSNSYVWDKYKYFYMKESV